jgi:uncharacterized protein YqgC (DUF456 family)
MFLPSWIVAPLSRLTLSRLAVMGSATSTWTEWIEPTGTVVAALILLILCFAAWATNLVALPGNWICVALLALYAWLGPQEGRANLGYGPVVAAGLFALIGESLEFLASALGAQRAGASRRSTLYALIGSIGGAITGAIVGLPVPVVGPILAAILFAGLGATAGAMIGEWSDGRPWRENWNIGRAAFWGRTFGTLGKVAAGLIIVLIAIAGVMI